ncbi:helix-turn-helix transcriptional regulator [Buttiauxella noackiae]|uniref:Putative DNA-binding protein n=1 Tax=Buttiauxella noackiae ATCC 51607 TaxID=1354255 RepID=A0A1B7HYI3_9ENTR|nr:DNA-binding protein [Buttiauxella noackiae]MCA1921928.1 DNA-binding protein [Buttiauxella noackiae]OAT20758.1 putative DNA-binding protein [Buttiauxella noackiae ATCC 51607]
MSEFSFTLIFTLPENGQNPEQWVEALGAQGCDDALVGVGVTGRIALNFIREASAAKLAVVSAIQDVKRIIPGTTLVEVMPDLVGLTDIAELLGFSRQYIRKVMVSREAFPQPVHDGKTAIWHLEPVLRWMREAGVSKVPLPLVELSAVTRQCNLQRELADLDRNMQKQLGKL